MRTHNDFNHIYRYPYWLSFMRAAENVRLASYKLCSSQSAAENAKLPPKSLSRSISNGFDMGCGYSEKGEQGLMQQVDESNRHSASTGHSTTSTHMDVNLSTQMSSGLMRYRSAPSTFLASLVDEAGDYLPRIAGSQEPDHAVIARYFSADSSSLTSDSSSGVIQSHGLDRSAAQKEPKMFSRMNTGANAGLQSAGSGNEDVGKHRLASILENGPEPEPEPEPEEVLSQDSFCNSQMMYRAQDSRSGMENSYRMNPLYCNPLVSSGGRINNLPLTAVKSNLVRHSSSPAGLLSRLAAGDGRGLYENGYSIGAVRNMGNISSENGSSVAPNRLGSQMNFMRQGSSTSGLSSQLSDMGLPQVVDKLNMPVGSSADSLGGSSSDDGSLSNGNGVQRYISSFPVVSWDDAVIVSEGFAGMQNGASFSARKRVRDLNGKMMPSLNLAESQKGDPSSHLPEGLNHQFSLTKSPSEIAMEKLLQDSVPCKIRAKRGCATHPRSIAERVRRTRISERMRKLQELVPNMDKQTNTADMLDEAVDYIKFLQTQVQELSENRPKCNCSCKMNASETT